MAGLPVRRIFLTFLLTGLSLSFGQESRLEGETNLCDKRPGFEPNGEHLEQPGDSLVVYVNWTNNSPSTVHRCLMRFSTCDYCSLRVRANSRFHFSPCRSSIAYREYDGWCVPGCTYVHLYDKFYSNQTAMTFTSSGSINSGILNFTTQSRFIYVIACANKTDDANVFLSLKITAEDKMQTFSPWQTRHQNTFTSPLFPMEYVLNSETYKYVFTGSTQNSFVTISFDDWQLSQYSSILFDRANVKGKIWGTNNRPWIISDSYRLEMTFDTGPHKIPGTLRSFKGFKATYTFHDGGRDDVPYVHTNCGQWIDRQESDVITFNPKGDGQDYYDCIWVIKKHPSFERVFIRVVNYSTTDKTYRRREPSLLEIREGLTSQGRLVISAVPSTNREDKLTFQDYDSSVGYYVRVRGHYRGHRDFVLAFSSFNIDQCTNMFWCKNSRCVPTSMECNGFDNCGDNSDEAYIHCGGPTTPAGSSSNSLLSPVIIIPMVVIIFAVIIICLLALFIRRCRRLSCEARRAQRQQGQGRISTVSSAVSNRQQRRRNRRRGEHRSERAGDPIHLPHDPPPSYEDVLNATPIGYLNLGFSDQTNSSTGLIQPPSYDEAISPTTHNPAFSFSPGDAQDESSDSSLPDTVRRSHLNLSSSYSSDDTHRAREGRHRQRGTVSSSSSDSSNNGEGLGAERRGRGEGEPRTREDGGRVDGSQTAGRQGGVKPEEAQIQLPVCSSADLAHNKSTKPHHKPAGGQENEDLAPALISAASASTPPGALSGPQGEGPASSSCRVEASPVIFAAAASATSEGQGVPAGQPNDQQREVPDPGAVCLFPPATSPQASQPQPADHLQEAPAGPGEAQSRHSPNRRIPPHILRARNAPSQTMMKHLSRSLNDLNQQPTENGTSHQQGFMLPRHLSQSMQNMLDSPAERPHRGAEHQPDLNRHHHHQSQTLPSQRDASYDPSAPHGRNGFLPPDGHTRRARSEDFAERNPSRSDPHGHPGHGRGDHLRPGPLPNEKPAGNQRSEGPPPAATRPKPQPKPRRLQHPGGNARPEPRQRQSLEGYSYRPSEDARSPESERGRGPHSDRNLQTRPAHPQGEGAWPARANRPQAPPRPDTSSRAAAASRGQEPPRPAHGSRERGNFGKESLPPPPPPPPQGQSVGPPHRHGDPPPYRPRPSSGPPARPPSLHSPSQPSSAPRPSEHSGPAEGWFQPGGDRARHDHPPHLAPTPRAAAASFPRMGVQAVPRSGPSAEGGMQSRGPYQGGHTGGPPAHSRSAAAPSSSSSSSSHRGPDREGSVTLASQNGAVAPFLTLRVDGEGEEDIYV